MEKSGLRPSYRTVEAEWIADQLAPFGSGIAAIVPDCFEAYVRVFIRPLTRMASPPGGLRWQQSLVEPCIDSHNSTPSTARP